MEGLGEHPYAPDRVKQDPDVVSPVDKAVQRIAQLVQEGKGDEAAVAYDEEVARLASTTDSFDINDFNQRMDNAGINVEDRVEDGTKSGARETESSAENVQETAEAPAPTREKRDHGYSASQLENVKSNLQTRLTALGGHISAEDAETLGALIDDVRRRRAVDYISDTLHEFETVQSANAKAQSQEAIEQIKKIEREETPYSDDQREHAKQNLMRSIEGLGLADDVAEELRTQIGAIQAPEDTINLVRNVRKLGKQMRRNHSASRESVPNQETQEAQPTVADTAATAESVRNAPHGIRGAIEGDLIKIGDTWGVKRADGSVRAVEQTEIDARGGRAGMDEWAQHAHEDPTFAQPQRRNRATAEAAPGSRRQGTTPSDVVRNSPNMNRGDFQPRPIVGEQNRAGRENEPTAQKVAQQLAQRHGTRPADVVPGPGNGGPELPRWAGQYGASWTDFDPSLYADVKNIKTIPEIRSNTLYNNLFGELAIAVDSSRASSLEKLARNEPLSGDDRLFFGYIQYELSKNIQECEWVEKNLSSKDLELMMSRDDDFRFFVAQNGVERTTQAFKERIFHKACQNKGEFSSFRDSLKDLKDNQKTGRAQKAERETKMWCDRFGIPPSRIGDFYDPNNRRQSEDRLAARIHERAGKFRKSIDWLENKLPKEITLLGSSSSSAARAIEEQRKNAPEKFSWSDPRSWVTGDRFGGIAENRQNMLDFLSVTVSDVEFRHAIEREAFLGEKVVPSIESGPASFGEMKGMLTKDANSQEAIRKRIRSIVDSDRHWNDKTPQEQDAVLRSHKATESLGQTKGMGFFAWILRAFFGFEYTKAASEELGRPVHI